MTVTDVAPVARLDDREYEAALNELRAYREQLDQADRQADTGSLDRAAALAKVYADKRWVDELPAPKITHFRGRPVVPDSRSRFARWTLERIGLRPAHTYQLLNAEELAGIISATAEVNRGVGERALRPLSKLLRSERAGEAPDVWRRAVQLADGEIPTGTHVRQALRDHDKATGRTATDRSQAYYQRTVSEARKKILREFDWILNHGNEDDIKAVLLELQQRLAALAKPQTK